MNEVQKFGYLERCIKEALRLYPSVPIIMREISEDLHLSKCDQTCLMIDTELGHQP